MSEQQYLEQLIYECQSKEKYRFANASSATEYSNLLDEIRNVVMKNPNNKQIILTAASYDASVIQYANEELKRDPEIILCAVKAGINLDYLGLDEKIIQIVEEQISKQKLEEQERRTTKGPVHDIFDDFDIPTNTNKSKQQPEQHTINEPVHNKFDDIDVFYDDFSYEESTTSTRRR